MKINTICKQFYRIFLVLVTGSLLCSCDRDRNHPGWDYFPDMFYSTAYETFSKNPNFKDDMTMRVPVEGTVPRGYTPFNYTNDPESRLRAGNELFNPFPASDENVERGKKIYSIFCLGCHGVAGGGNGILFTSGLYPLQPRTLTDDKAKKLKDGEIYHSVTVGFGSMGAHGAQIRPEDRWKLVMYVRSLQDEAKGSSGVADKGK